MNAELEQLNVPMIHKIFKEHINKEQPLMFIRNPNAFGVGSGVTPAIVEVDNTIIAFKRLAKNHCYDPSELYNSNGMPLLYSKEY